MTPLKARLLTRARAALIPLNVHLDLTWKCNERCVHCYLDEKSSSELTTVEVYRILDQLAEAGTLFLIVSGGESMLRRDIFDILSYARSKSFDLTLKTNGTLVKDSEARRLAELRMRRVAISLYSHRPEIHDSITRLPGSFARTIESIRLLRSYGVRVDLSAPLMRDNAEDGAGVKALANDLGAALKFAPNIRPKMGGDAAPLLVRLSSEALRRVYNDPLLFEEKEFASAPPDENWRDAVPCGAGHNACYISPEGNLLPCASFPIVCGNLRVTDFQEIWRSSPKLREIRQIRNRDLHVCGTCTTASSCSRCPGLALVDGDMRGPSRLDCERTYARTRIPTPLIPATGIKPASPTS